MTPKKTQLTDTIDGRKNDIVDLLKNDKVSTIVIAGNPGTGKTWTAREISECAVDEDLCYAILWISVTEEYKIETMPKEKTQTISEESETKIMSKDKTEITPDESKTEIILEESKIETIPEESKTETTSKDKTENIPEEFEAKIILEESKTETMPKDKTDIIPEESKTETNMKDKTEPIPEESKTETKPEEPKIQSTRGGSGSEVYKAKTGLLEDAIARQILSQSSFAEEWEVENNVKKEENKQTIDQMVQSRLREKKAVFPPKKKKFDLLLVLDESGNQMIEYELWEIVLLNVRKLLPSIKENELKTIITTREFLGKETQVTKIDFNLPFKDELNLFLKSFQRQDLSAVQSYENLDVIVKKCKGLPAVITMIAEAIARRDLSGLTLESALEKAADYVIATEEVNPLIHCAYEMLPSIILKNCFCHSLHFFKTYGGIHYIELITQWILEGYFDSFDLIKKKYQKGHAVLMELLDRRMLKIQEENIIVAEALALKMIDCLPRFLGTSRLGLAGVVSEKNQRIALGRITQIDGMIKTVCDPKKWQEVSTLLIDGNRLRLEVDEEFFARMKALEALAIFNSGLKSLVLSASKPEKQSPEPEKLPKKEVLVLRSCDMLDTLTSVKELKTLIVLEISGVKSMKAIEYDMFDGMTQLQTLNLSGCQMKLLPSLSKLTKLRFLILKGCSSLEKLPRIKELHDLEIIDLSGATSLSFFPEQDLSSHPKLQMIDLSHTQVKRLPKFGNLENLSRISLSGCHKVRIFPSLQKLRGLKILYLSEVEFLNFHKIKPKDSNILPLPLIPVSISELYVRDCPTLKFLPPISELKNLQVLDASGSSDAEFAISDDSFDGLHFLRKLDISNTKLKKLPPLSNLPRLRELLLKNCRLLEKLPEMKGLEKLEVLDLSGCSNLVELPNLNDFPKLEVLDISNTGIKENPRNNSALIGLKVITEKKNRHEYGVFNLVESRAKGEKPSILVNDGKIFQSLKEKLELEEECIKQISMPTDEDNRYSVVEVMFSDIYLHAKSVFRHNEEAKFLEIRGLERFIAGLKGILENIEFVSLVEHMSIKSLSDLDSGSFAKMKGCWIARCLEMESIFKENKDAEIVQKLEILWVSNLPKVKGLFNQSVNLEKLKHLHLDCCPNIKYVFSSSQIPVNLEVLEIKFCDSLDTVYKKIEDGPDQCTLSKLHTLLLFELPELKGIGFTMPNAIIWECPKLQGSPAPPIEVENGHLKFSCRPSPSTVEINVVA